MEELAQPGKVAIDMCIVNAYRLFTLQTGRTVSQLEFRIALMEQLGRAYPPQRAPSGPLRPARSGRPSHPHFPSLGHKALDCAYCSNQATRRKRSRYVCDHCPVHLCVTPCFKLYHEHQRQGQ